MKTLHFQFHDAGAYDGETIRYVMCSFYSLRDGQVNIGQSQLVPEHEWPKYRAHIESCGWQHRELCYERHRAA